MLEFQQGFFNQEVRDGFYLDVTIKTLWAAEMELLQKIAEVCDRYELRWFAAYGTLLGAIRHEGYVPWDDDMDIWLIRNDYNKLLEVLPKELPKGYRVRGPQTEEGYDQFHTCVNNGNGISIAKDWLEENHNCPFTVGIDIFPLDYLPRDKKNQELQKNLFTLVGRVAQLSKNIARGDYDDANAAMTKDDAIAQINEGLKYLKKNFKFKLDKQWIADEKWDKIASEVWKWGNYVAMMYTEQESDYLVEYLDWVKWDSKKFPKEWFEETYAASFENFMLPIPCKYDEILTTIYSRYNVIMRNDASHEYPFYARQLRQLRQYVKDAEKGILGENIDEVVEKRENLPNNFKIIIDNAKKENKKIVLSANNMALFMENPTEAMDKLEVMLQFFKKNTQKVVLWWRPHPLMCASLERISPEFAERYKRILDWFKTGDWWICDEGDNTDWAVENCDMYYGEMNAILQPFQNRGKAIILNEGTSDSHSNNLMMLLLTRTFINLTDFTEVNDKIYFFNTNYNAMVVLDKISLRIENMIQFDGADVEQRDMHYRCIEKEGKICFLPVGNGPIRIYDTRKGTQKIIEIDKQIEGNTVSWDSFKTSQDIYLLPAKLEYGLWIWDAENDCVRKQEWWSPGEAEGGLLHGAINEESFYSLVIKSNTLLITNVKDKTVQVYNLPDDDVCTIQGDGETFWYTKWDDPKVVSWNIKTGKTKRKLLFEENYLGKHIVPYYSASYMVGKKLFVVSRLGENILMYDTETDEIKHINSMKFDKWDFLTPEKKVFIKNVNDKLYISMRCSNKFRVLDLHSLNVEEYQDCFSESENIEYRNRVLMKRGVLLYDEQGEFDASQLLLL